MNWVNLGLRKYLIYPVCLGVQLLISIERDIQLWAPRVPTREFGKDWPRRKGQKRVVGGGLRDTGEAQHLQLLAIAV